VKLAEKGVYPGSHIMRVVREFHSPSFNYKPELRSVWGLNAAVTHVLKGVRDPMVFHERTLRLGIELDSLVAFRLGMEFRQRLESALS
jgi:hypothetical protein